MKKVLLCIVLFTFVSMVGLFAYSENESNNTPASADMIPRGTLANVVLFSGNINQAGDVDWVGIPLNDTNNCTIDFVSFGSANTSVDFYSDVPPTTVEGTATTSSSYTSAEVNQGDVHYYIRIYGTAATYPSSYLIRITNEDDNTFLTPVTLSSFMAVYTNNEVGITWVTQSESNLAGYNVIRSDSQDMTKGLNVNGAIIYAHNSSSITTYNFKDEEIEAGGSYYYWLEVVEIDGGIDYHGPVNVEITEDDHEEETPDLVYRTGIVSSYPNPFSHNIDLQVEMSKLTAIELSVYNIKGEKVDVIHNGELTEGTHTFNWDGKDVHGRSIANGIYFFRLDSYEGSYTRKVTFIK